MHMKKVLTLFCTMLMLLSICVLPAYAIESSNTLFPNTVTGRLISDDGTIIQVTGYRRNVPSLNSLFSDERAVTYDYIIPLSDKAHEDNVSGYDPSYYFSATLTIYYTEYDVTPSEYLLTRVSGEWSDPEPTDGTTISNTADIVANCTGIGTNNIFRRQVKEGSITSGSYMDTGFDYSIQSYMGAMGAYMYIDISQGILRQWTLELECFPIDPTI